ncbi:unnamed protein product [Paramecium primaurelia]|uniref:Uncharacterized protein n=1 Tax=Paramecium primaurelia TaxID=5886 RepID=A0A8S1P6R6_PARPR|nr:unnamed protein product [Paramecium primaurelia]
MKMMDELEIKQLFIQILEDLDSQNFFESFSIADSIEYVNNLSKEHYSGTFEFLKPKIKQIDDIRRNQFKLHNYQRNMFNLILLDQHQIQFISQVLQERILIILIQVIYVLKILNWMDLATWKNLICKEKPSLLVHEQTIRFLDFSDDSGKFLISGSEEGVIIKSELSADQEIQLIQKNQNISHQQVIFLKTIEVSKQTQMINIQLSSKKMLLYSFSQSKIQQNYQHINNNINFAQYQLLDTGDTKITIWNAQNISDVQQILELPERNNQAFGIAFQEIIKYQLLDVRVRNQNFGIFRILINVTQVAYSNNGKFFALNTCSSFKIYEVQKLPYQQDFFRLHTLHQIDLDCQILASSTNQQISIWDIKNLFQIKLLSILKEHSKKISTLKFRNDNLVLVSGSLNNIICLWNLLNLQLIVKLTTHLDQDLDLAFSSDGQQTATSSLDKPIIFWSMTNLDKPIFK